MANTETSGDAARPWQSYTTVYTNAKAGIEGVDKEKVQIASSLLHSSVQNSTIPVLNKKEDSIGVTMPTMSEILESSRSQKFDLKLQTLGPFYRITAKSLETEKELGRAGGFIRVWLRGRILRLDSIRLRRETIGMEKSIFGIGLFIGAVAIRQWLWLQHS